VGAYWLPPTAIPVAPFINNVGTRVGITFGSYRYHQNSTENQQFLFYICHISSEIFRILASV
jgi:hypothetical protein